MFDYEREEMLQEVYAENEGAEAARRHNAWEAHWARCEEEEREVEEQAAMEAERNFNTLQAWD
jgi:hypothetical protein